MSIPFLSSRLETLLSFVLLPSAGPGLSMLFSDFSGVFGILQGGGSRTSCIDNVSVRVLYRYGSWSLFIRNTSP